MVRYEMRKGKRVGAGGATKKWGGTFFMENLKFPSSNVKFHLMDSDLGA